MISSPQKITPFLWFDREAEDAANFYVSIFRDSRIVTVTRYGKAGPGPEGSVMTVGFQLAGQLFVALNGGPQFKITPGISFVVGCADQAELDAMWEKLSAGGTKQECGWVQDRFGVSWQIVPSVLGELLSEKAPKKAHAVMAELLQMQKLDLAKLKQAYERV